ncbi:alpha/beta-hydrolase [Colletotrichum caudatum]|nr:alpha/beta-hydrolase [Colletotrichum caudatum]
MAPYYVNSIQVLQRPSPPVAWDRPKEPCCVVLPAGSRKTPESRPLDCDIILERDQPLTLRDGVSIRIDIYRPKTEGKVPAILMWSPYGKSGTGKYRLDPAEWVPKGYAIINADAREGRDGYDAVEEIAKLPWCTGKVAMAGNSWLAICQWFIAAERPPHLACIAPLEGCSDHLRENVCRGGIPEPTFGEMINATLAGRNMQEDYITMLDKYPHCREYWDDKRARIDRIQVPAYILGSFSTQLHTIGSFRAFEEIPHQRKWITVHATQEWYDLYTKSRIDDLQRFFDWYLKGIENDWEQTPPVRLAVLGFNKPPILDLPFDHLPWHFPYTPTTCIQKLFLTQNKSLQLKNEAKYSTLDYQDTKRLELSYTFEQLTTLAGPTKLVPNINPLKYLGPSGHLRASRRKVAPELSQRYWQTLSHDTNKPVRAGEIVELEVWIWPSAIQFGPGEQLVVNISGNRMGLPEFERIQIKPKDAAHQIVHVGGQYQSYLEVIWFT